MKKLILIVIASAILQSCACTKETTLKPSVNWVDDIRNTEENQEYIEEVVFNNDIKKNDPRLQYLFCERYYETLGDSSKIWYNSQK